MRVMKWALLASAAVISGPAFAADMAAKKAPPPVKPIDYVKMCGEFGEGFYYVPGAATCLKIGGGVRAQIVVHSRNIGSDYWDSGKVGDISGSTTRNDSFVMGSRALVNLDARSKTDYGTLRGYIEFAADGITSIGNGAPLTLRHAYVQLGSESYDITAGTTDSFFTPDGALGGFGGAVGDRGVRLPLLAYTYKFSKMLSATVSIEDHDVIDGNSGFKAAPGTEECTAPSSTKPLCDSGSGVYLAPGQTAINDSTLAPDVVGMVKGTFDWGLLFASAALSNNRVLANPTATSPWFKDEELGYAVAFGGNVKLDSIAKGDAIQAKATYADGATSYLSGGAGDVGILDTVGPDLGILTTTGFAVQGSFLHNWSPTWSSVAYSGYASFDRNPSSDAAVIALAEGNIESAYNVGANLAWTPVAGMTVGAEAFYGSATLEGASADTTNDAVGGIFRFERGF